MKKFYMLLVLIMLLLNAVVVQSQIQVYTHNKSMFVPNTFDVDMFKDALPYDYAIRADYADIPANTGYEVKILSVIALNEVMVVNDSLVKPLNLGDPINETSVTWTSNSLKWMYMCHVGTTAFGQWMDVNNRYIGIRMYKNGDYFYGWIQMTILSSPPQPTITVIDMAYQKTAGKAIEAGQTVGIKDENPDLAKYILNNRILQIETVKPVTVSITNISGQMLTSTMIKSAKAIDLSAWAKGIYLLRIAGEEGVMTRKIVLQ